MNSSELYPEMDHIFAIYFGQDFDLFGETVPEIVACYKKDSPYHYEKLLRELGAFRQEHPNDLDSAFEKDYGRDFDPKLWGYTTASFFDELKRLLSE
ncbi:contact-dependent growth inhibition system immunity protein [Paraburkholderia susongensis]|uniref:CdiI immunity protein domain-containing protein n=1 Tax=Paraburkholderia susongensis TaxID=1515439 RepID=A0A1X7M107_9BURK|nr:contact-dependent growth inhibition system immunity protein [Paraburkholderia susongensis]SMG59387.1 hypothetical protein SAMN06265784_11317 [Paraburkholderia susongensis]